jgi:hypothetical protein
MRNKQDITVNKVPSLLGVASTLRRAKSKAPALQRLFCKAGALLLTRRSVDATPSKGSDDCYILFRIT